MFSFRKLRFFDILRNAQNLSTRAGKEKSSKTLAWKEKSNETLSIRAEKERSNKALGTKDKSQAIRCHGELLYGLAPCIAALHTKRRKVYAIYQKPGSLEKKAASKRAAMDETQLHRLAEEMKVDKHWVEGTALDRVTGNRPHQGIVLDVAPLNFRRMDAADCKLSFKERRKNPVWILLDEVQDPMNLGAILRVSYFLGVSRIITSPKRCCPLSPTVSKASAGIMEVMPVYSITHLQNFIASAKDDGWSILGTAGPGKSPEEVKGGRGNSPEEVKEGRENQGQGRENQGQGRENQGQGRGHTEDSMPKTKSAKMTIDCRDYVKHGPTLLVLGNEGHGIHKEVEKECEAILTVQPHRQLPPFLDSLNVAVATGVILHALQRTTP